MVQKLSVISLLWVAPLLVVACSESSGSVTKIKKEAVAYVATVPFEGPLLYQKDEELVGMDAELARQIAARIGQVSIGPAGATDIRVHWNARTYSTIIAAVENAEAQLAIAVLGVTEERKSRVAFSTPYYTSELVLIINPVARAIKGTGDLAGAKVGVREGTAVEELVKEKFPQAKAAPFKTLDDAVLALKRGEIDAAIDDRYMAVYALDSIPGLGHLEILPGVVGKVECAVAVGKRDKALLEIVNEVIEDLKQENQFATWINDHIGDRIARVEARHAQRLERERKAREPRRVAIRVTKDASSDFDIYRLANLSFVLTDQNTGQSYQSSRIDFQQRVGVSQVSVPPGHYMLELRKFGFRVLLSIETTDPGSVRVNIGLPRGSVRVEKG